jgi:prevent-host-death family protein
VKQINVHEAKTELSKLLERVEGGERIIIARAGKPVAVLSRYERKENRRGGQFEGQVKLSDDFDTLPSDIARAFDGEAP